VIAAAERRRREAEATGQQHQDQQKVLSSEGCLKEISLAQNDTYQITLLNR
jgi:hypothetical protein